MIRDVMESALRGLAVGLPSGPEGAERLLERVAAHPLAETLRAVLVELGAASVLGAPPRPIAPGMDGGAE